MNTFAGELDSMERMLMQTELTVIAGDHESYRISAKTQLYINQKNHLSFTRYIIAREVA